MIPKDAAYFSGSMVGIAQAKSVRSDESAAVGSVPLTSERESPVSDEMSDEALVGQMANGARAALALLLRRHGRAVYNVARRILKDESEAEDLRQDIFIYIFQKASRFDCSKGTAASWIIQMAYHRAIDRRRYLQSRCYYDRQELLEDRTFVNPCPNLGDTVDGHALLTKLRDELTAEQVRVIELHFFEGYSFREIAENIGQNYGNVRSLYYRGIQRLRNHIFRGKPPQSERTGRQ
ncbi:RNA polymerase sigma factor [Terriglobus albidus]|uniref:RNA polymerase sigma factor n=1 Tax=Terriglobus albidus TaxID=1592106 RepID=UPI0021DFAFA0|nr:sigma-70 family RNA polymerase sigma factor [Terriglobus albidus]